MKEWHAFAFESSVILEGTKTSIEIKCGNAKFESNVILEGTKTGKLNTCMLENTVYNC